MELAIDILSNLLTAIGAVIAILFDFKLPDGPQKGRLTPSGRVAVALVGAGLLVGIVKTIADARSRVVEAEAEREASARLLNKTDVNTFLLFQAREVKRIGLGLKAREDITSIPANCTFVAYLRNKNRDTFRIALSLNNLVDNGAPPDTTIKEGVFFNDLPVTSHIFADNLGIKGVSIKNSDMSDDKVLLHKFGDLDQITYYISIRGNSASDAVQQAISCLQHIWLHIDRIIIDDFSPNRSAWPLLVSSTTDEAAFMSEPHEEVMFRRTSPDWNQVIDAEMWEFGPRTPFGPPY